MTRFLRAAGGGVLHCAFALLLGAGLLAAEARAEAPLRVEEVPAPLAPWWAWALHGEVDPACPYVIASGARQCAWPGRLELDVGADGARFALAVEAWAAAELPLPGRDGQWPQDVMLDGVPAVVTVRAGVPSLRIPAGRHRIAGRYLWRRAPETLRLPPDYGLLELRLDGRAVPNPQRAADGELWLQTPASTAADAERDALKLAVYRRIVDELPLQVETLLELDVAGTQREVLLDGGLLAEGLPLRLASPLPARLERDGRLRVQLRPGHWQLRLDSRQPGPVAALARPAGDAHWPAEEVWVFDARPALRVVEIGGGQLVDPRQTGLPAAWQSLPAFRLGAGEALRFAEQRRGDPEPAPNRLELTRELWLDFDGGGWTVRDAIGGELTRGWRLDAGPDLVPGRVLLNGAPQFITALDGRRGVEVRRGAIDLRADSRIEEPGALNAVGWAHDFDRVSATLNLPPGWRLWSASGVDAASDTWLRRWTLLDLFLVFIVALAVAKQWSWPLGGLALLALLLCWHEPGAPRQVWLHVLAAVALVRVLPIGRLRSAAALYRNAALLVLVVLALGFAIDQVRIAIYPQLEDAMRVDGYASAPSALPAPAPMREQQAEAGATAVPPVPDAVRRKAASGVVPSSPRYALQSTYDPKATIQTGPGVPSWQWRAARLTWSGPVTAAQPLELVLLSPRVNFLLAILRVAALAALIAIVLRRALGGPTAWQRASAALLLVLGLNAQAAGNGPDPALLEELKRRALLPPECAPEACVSLPRLDVTLAEGRLQLRMRLHVGSLLGVPLPGQAEQWLPETVLVDGEPVAVLRRDDKAQLLVALDAGVHELVLDGAAPRRASFQLTLPLAAQSTRIEAAGWAIDGVDRDTGRATQLIFTRMQENAETGAAQETSFDRAQSLPPFFTLERRLELGLDWRVHNRLLRVTPPGVGAALAIPLLPGEAVITQGIEIADGRAKLALAADETERHWTSVLAKTERLTLRAAPTTDWAEIWRADIAPIWHVELAGIPLVHQRDEDGAWLPTWRPWPGEEASLEVSRPAGVPGRTLTIDRSELRLAPGLRASDATLSLSLRSSQGGQHLVELPADASLQAVTIDGVAQPIRQDGRRVSLPVAPGEREVMLRWRSPTSISSWFRTPAFSLGADSVNAALSLSLPADRWVLFTGGPPLGPAVLFWGALLVVALASFALGRLRLAPIPTWQWGLLGVGLTQSSVGGAVLVVGWLLALGLRARLPAEQPNWRFNLVQIALVLLSCAALGALFDAIAQGLLGQPSMQIAGNGSSAGELRWFVDRAGAAYPQAWVLSVSIWIYRGLMLAWALWLAFALLGWLRWGWRHFSRDGVWRRVRFIPARRAGAGAD
ncbi:MAG TPA: hypothetical protein PJ986_05645 [Gammaproteobacteria bacterium]|nr:hypothetical protein [Gammaproteobacteria bacterium]